MIVYALAAAALVRFAQAFVRLRRRGRSDHAGWGRALLFVTGLAVTVVPLVSLDSLADTRLSGHMLQHVLIGDLAPALMVVALRGPLLAFFLPAPLGRVIAWIESLPAWAVLGVWAAALGAWHVPAAYDGALTHPAVHEFEHASFVVAGLLVWSRLVDPGRRGALSLGRRLAFAGALLAFGQVLADVLFLSGPLYAAYPSVTDQQLAGLVMMAEQTVTLGVLAVCLVGSSVRGARTSPRGRALQAATA